MNAQISNNYLNIILTHLRRTCDDEASCFAELGLQQYSGQTVDPAGFYPFDDFLRLLHTIEAHTNNPLFCAQAGSYIHPADYGEVGLMLMNCENYGHVVTMSYRFQRLVNNVLPRQPYVINRAIFSRIIDDEYLAEDIRPYIELEAATLVHMSHFLTGHMFRDVPITLKFRHKAKAGLSEYQKIYNTNLRFDCDYNEIKMPSAVMQAPLRGNNPELFSLLYKGLREKELELKREMTLIEEIKVFIETQLFEQVPKLEQCAHFLQTSTSTLKRKLSDENSSYQKLLDEVRYHRARVLLKKFEYSITDLSDSMGFSSSASFSRSFRKWSGVTPSQYRQQLKHDLKNDLKPRVD